MAGSWFKRTFTEEGDNTKRAEADIKKQQEEQAKEGILLSKLPEYEWDNWQETHKGFRMEKLATVLQKNIIGFITLAFVCVTVLFMFVAQSNATLLYDTETKSIRKFPDSLYTGAALVTGIIGLVFLGLTVAIVLYFRRVLDKFYDNGKVYDIYAKNFLNERWHIKLYNGFDPEPEPVGKAILKEQKTEVEKQLGKLRAMLGNPPKIEGQDMSQAELEAHKVQTQAEITKYESVKTKLDACIKDRMTICSAESRDHEYIWKYFKERYEENGAPKERVHSVLEKEIGWKVYFAVPGPNLVSCTGKDELLTDIGWKFKKMDNYQLAACVDLPAHPDIIKDSVTGNAVVRYIPRLGVRDTPNGGAYYDWTEADGILVSKVQDIPISASLQSALDERDHQIATLEQRLLEVDEEQNYAAIPAILDQLRKAGKLPEPVQQLQEPQPQQPVQPIKNNSRSYGKTALIASACVLMLGLGGLGILSILSSIL